MSKRRPEGNDREKNRADTKDEVMLEMLKFMKEERLHRSPKKDKDEHEERVGKESTKAETVQTGIELPKMKPADGADATLRCGDWLSVIGLKIRSLSTTAEEFWKKNLRVAEETYHEKTL